MCWNQEVSLNTFLFSSFVLLLIIYNNTYTQYKIKEFKNVWGYLFFAVVFSIQLIEFFIWRNIKNVFYNHLFSLLAAFVVIIQPVVSLMIITNYKTRNMLISLYLILAIPYSIYRLTTSKIISTIAPNGHLQWYSKGDPLFVVIAWLFFFLFSFAYEKIWIGFWFGLITLIITVYNYKNDHTIGSMWCWSVNSIMIYYAFYLLLYLPFCEKKSIC